MGGGIGLVLPLASGERLPQGKWNRGIQSLSRPAAASSLYTREPLRGRFHPARSPTQQPPLSTLPGGAGEAASLVPKLPRGSGRIASGRALTEPSSAARIPAPRPSSRRWGDCPFGGGRGRARVLPPKRSRGGSGARRIAPAAFGDFWPVKSRAPVPARGRTSPAHSRGFISGQWPLHAPLARNE